MTPEDKEKRDKEGKLVFGCGGIGAMWIKREFVEKIVQDP